MCPSSPVSFLHHYCTTVRRTRSRISTFLLCPTMTTPRRNQSFDNKSGPSPLHLSLGLPTSSASSYHSPPNIVGFEGEESLIRQAPNASVPVDHFVVPIAGGRRPDDDEIPILQAPNTVDPLDQRLSPISGSRRRPAQRRPRDDGRLGGLSWLEISGFVFLSYNGGMAVYQSWGDVAAISLVAFMYLNIIILLLCLKLLRRAPPDSTGRKNRLRASVWVLTMALTFGYVYQVIGTAGKPTLQMALLQWAMPAATGIAVFTLFCQKDRSDTILEEELLDV